MARHETATGGREATKSVIPGRFALSVGLPSLPEPQGFQWTKLADVARLESGHTPSRGKAEYWNGEIPWIGIRDATGNHGLTITATEQFITDAGLANSSARLLPAGTVCLSRTASVGFVVTMGVAMATSQDFVNWVCGPALSSRYLHYVLVAEQESVRRFAHGTTHQTMYYPEAKALHVLLPDRREQDAIAEVLGALDDKIAANARLATCADELAGLAFDVAIAGAPLGAMSSMLTPVLGGTPTRARSDYWGGDRLWASAKDVTGAPFGIVIATQESITAEAVSQTKAKPLPKGSVLLTARGTVGAVARLGSPSSLNQSCYGFVPGDFPPGVLYFSILRATDRAKAFAHGSVFDTITMRTFDHLEVVKLPGSELRRVEARVGPLLAKVEQVVRENESLTAMRDALLPQLMSGKIRVKDTEQMVGDVV